ncbi:MAG: hypothetical protein A2046_08300 [Bacteroidetes bacterium GWA2_30_7]|nr:MAG: hypothetical protein A2046_08300 [Bacteroidetes bacterium GWA2_30_7]
MKNLYLIFLCLISLNGFSQINQEIKTEQVAHYPEGDDAFFMYLTKTLNYSPEAKLDKIRGKLMFSFDVDADSTISNIVFMNNIGYGVEDSLKNLLTPLKFAPKIMNGKKFKSNTMFTFPVFAH